MIKSWIAWSHLSLLSTWKMYSFLVILSNFCLPSRDLNLCLLTYALLLNLDFLHMRNFRCWVFSFPSQNSMTYIFGSLHQRLRHEHDIIFWLSFKTFRQTCLDFFSFCTCLDKCFQDIICFFHDMLGFTFLYISLIFLYMLRWTLLG